MNNNTLQQAEVYWINLDPTEGREMEKTRPCVIIKPLDYWELAIIVPLSTSTHFTTSHYTLVQIASGIANLRQDSIALCHHIRSVSYRRIRGRIGTLPERDFGRIMTALQDFMFDE